MTKDDIIRMAREADLVSWLPTNKNYSDGLWWIDAHEPGEELERFAALVAAAEREACAKVCDELETCSDAEFYGYEFAAAIRARGQA
jgi:hypothetical protein